MGGVAGGHWIMDQRHDRRTAYRAEFSSAANPATSSRRSSAHREDSRRVEKLLGADVELGNSIRGARTLGGSGAEASRRLLAQIDGIASARPSVAHAGVDSPHDPRDHGRTFLTTCGGCAYIDLDHLELCAPEVRSAHELVAASRALLLVALDAKLRADRELPEGQSIELVANNSDGSSHSYGSHLNILVTREAWRDLFERRLHYQQWLASFQVSLILLSGQGKVGAENGETWADYQISQRADFIEALCGPQTTHHRPLVNTRDEAHCGVAQSGGDSPDPARDYARLHVIALDHTLCEGASLLRAGCMQIALAMIEAERVDAAWLLDDPVSALRCYSRDPGLDARAPLVSGYAITLVDLQRRFLDAALVAHAAGELETVPRAGEILALWCDTLERLAARDFPTLFGRLDWVTKREQLDDIRVAHGFDWRSSRMLHLDQLYASLDPERGLFWALARHEGVERFVADEEIHRFLREPPADTRAHARVRLLRSLDAGAIERIDWDRIELSLSSPAQMHRALTLFLGDPLDPISAALEGDASRFVREALSCEDGPWAEPPDNRAKRRDE
jgi:proteasome accessory factor A